MEVGKKERQKQKGNYLQVVRVVKVYKLTNCKPGLSKPSEFIWKHCLGFGHNFTTTDLNAGYFKSDYLKISNWNENSYQ